MHPQRFASFRIAFFLARSCFAVVCFSAFGKDLMMTNHAQVLDTDQTRRPTELEIAAKVEPQCKFGRERIGFCPNLSYTGDAVGPFKDVSALPLANSATSVKVGVARYNLFLGPTLVIPFSLLSSNVAGTANTSKLNSLKLLDPDQGNLNLKLTYGGRYHIGEVCKFEPTEKGGCNFTGNLGYRYLGLEKSTGPNNTSGQGVYGFYFELSNSFVFPVRKANGHGKKDDAGDLAIKLSASRFQQNAGDVVLFPDAHDANGNPLKVSKSYTGFAASVELHITDKIGVQANRYKAGTSNSFIGNMTTVSVSLEIQ